jgi:hypothetical protein
MSFKNRLGIILVIFGFMTIPFVRFGEEFLLVSAFLLAFGAVRIVRDLGVKDRLGNLMGSMRRPVETQAKAPPKIDPLLPVRVLKLAESRSGVITVSTVAMALNVGLDECQLALDELVRKGAANVDVDLSTGVASYSFPEFLPHAIEDAGSI